jgi:uncharacterized membrane protein
MTLAPLLEAPLAVQAHVATVTVAWVLGACYLPSAVSRCRTRYPGTWIASLSERRSYDTQGQT